MIKNIRIFGLLIILVLTTLVSPVAAKQIPLTGEANFYSETIDINYQKISFQTFSQFIKSVTIEKSGSHFTGIISPKMFTLPITQQPAGQPGFVSNEPEKITEFALANQYGSTGLLAHNHLAGAYFSSLQVNDLLIMVNANKEYKFYRIEKISAFQALSPNSPYSNFVDLDNTSRTLNATDLFMEVYTAEGSLVLQTCIALGDELSWGRLFIQAFPVEEVNFNDLINLQNRSNNTIL
jgi:hypothetical protein